MKLCTKTLLLTAAFLTVENIKGGLGEEPVDNPEKIPDDAVKEIQKYLDNLLQVATSSFNEKKLDPVEIPSMEKSFRRKILFADLNGGFQTFNSSLKGLSSLHRDGEIYATWENDDTLKVEVNMVFDNLEVDSKATFWFSKIRKTLSLIAKIRSVKVNTVLDFPFSPDRQARASALTVRDMSRAELDVKGLAPLNWMLEGVGFVVERSLRKKIRNELGTLMINVINKELGSIDILSFLVDVLI